MGDEIINISLFELSEMEGLSVRTQNVCEFSNLKDLYSILNYYLEYGDFLRLRNCGSKSNVELIDICTKYENFKIKFEEETIPQIKNEEINIDLKELSEIEDLSVRTHNICEDNNLNDLFSVLNYYWENNGFLKLRNCGFNSNIELVNVCNKYNKYFIKPQVENPTEIQENSILSKINLFSIKQKSIINNLIEIQIRNLTNRSRSGLMHYLNCDITLQNFAELLYDPTFKIKNIRMVGEISEIEIKSMLNSIEKEIEFVSGFNNDLEVGIWQLKVFMKLCFSIDDNLIREFVEDYDISKGLPVFKIIKVLIDNDIILDSREKIIFCNEYCLHHAKNDVSSINIPAIKGLTRERVRQIKVKFLQRFNNIFNFITQPELKSLINYNLDLTCNNLEITNDLIDYINKSEKTNFNRLFITKIVAILYSDKYDLIGQLEQKNSTKNTNSENWQGCYIVDKEITSIIDFDKLIDDVKNRLTNKIEEEYELYFQSYLLNFIKTSDYRNLDLIAEIAEYILFNEFDININTNDCVVFTKNTKVQIIDYVYEALEKMKEPLTIYELYNIIETKYPGVTKSASSLRGICQGDQKLFFIGRSSTYGLKVWENDLSIKGGTIRDIAEEYLKNQTEPKHIDEITEYVNKYRDTNSNSIRANLHVDESKRFVFFSGMLIGITNKEYSTEKYAQAKEIQIERKTWEERFVCLQHFVEENNRIPCSTGSEFEIKLYRFMNFQLNKANASAIDNTEISKIFELVSKYNYKKKKRHTSTNLKESYAELRDFVLKNERLPRANYKDEKILYRFFYRQRKLFLEQSLSIEFKEKFIEIANLLNHTI